MLNIDCFLIVSPMPKARLEIAVERLSEAEGSGKNGRDWLVKELARVVQETHVLQAEVLKRDEVVLEIHDQVIVIFVARFWGSNLVSATVLLVSPWITLAEPKSFTFTLKGVQIDAQNKSAYTRMPTSLPGCRETSTNDRGEGFASSHRENYGPPSLLLLATAACLCTEHCTEGSREGTTNARGEIGG